MMQKEMIVSVIDDDLAICRSIRWLLESVNLKVATYTNPKVYLKEYKEQKSGCILIDVRMPEMSGLELQKELHTKGNTLPVIMMTGHGDVTMAVRAMKAGAVDFITKPFNDQLFIETIQAAIESLPLASNTQHETVFTHLLSTLTLREKQIMEKMVTGKLSKVIADELHISVKTVEFYRASIMKKMKAKNLASLIKMNILKQYSDENIVSSFLT